MGKKWNIEHADLIRRTNAQRRAERRAEANATLAQDVEDAFDAARQARELRENMRRITRKGPERDERIDQALALLREAIRPIRSALGRSVYGLAPGVDRKTLLKASHGIAAEREKLRRMKS